ncbi:phospho-N-acetylmuramoyl-pentapeptide-transferase [Helicobacter jaachi]|uniref:Phospho-N-acetylmuramoyl-pentapeptide-transferase n=1 Tax=Helicobacter jaachi TaxID=1677920 RepID=A0A4U8TBC1_9HELI|nr:phospho-N-acetylmuramoyl-pentapeptide-transferase [Helicobacter jaachi]TLD97191.1 phospho-N-acetylmuramoyl-pentapeptide-transferase [Helicobacter jaachi]
MLYWFYQHFDVNIFSYITFRAGVAFFLAFISSVLCMPYFIKWAKLKKANQPISGYVAAHEGKKNTPTMGGIVFIASMLFASLMCANLFNPYVLLGLFCVVSFGLIGAKDDYMKIAAKSNAGMRARVKFFLLFVISFIIASILLYIGHNTNLYIPFMKHPLFDMGVVKIAGVPFIALLFWILVFLATSNAVNITDGLDGLATVPSICALFSLSIFVYVAGHAGFSGYLLWPKVVDSGELAILSVALIGALIGFLWYNCHPAQVFMGDSGSLAIGGFIAFMAIVSNNEILLLLIGIIFVIEALSVILQIGSYKYRQKRIFAMAPIHHHFEVRGWAENKIIVRFWIIAILANLIAILSLKIR